MTTNTNLIHAIADALIKAHGQDRTEWFECGGRAKVERGVAGWRAAIEDGAWIDRPEDILVLRALRHVEHTVELAGDARIEPPRIRALVNEDWHGRRRAAKARIGGGGLRARCSTLHYSHSACVRDVLELLSIDAHAMALDRHEEALRHPLPHPDDPVDGGRIRQQAHGVEPSFGDIAQVAQIAEVSVAVQLVQELFKLAERGRNRRREPGQPRDSLDEQNQPHHARARGNGEPSGRCRWS